MILGAYASKGSVKVFMLSVMLVNISDVGLPCQHLTSLGKTKYLPIDIHEGRFVTQLKKKNPVFLDAIGQFYHSISVRCHICQVE